MAKKNCRVCAKNQGRQSINKAESCFSISMCVYDYLLQIACLAAVIVVSRGMVIHLYVVPVRTKAM